MVKGAGSRVGHDPTPPTDLIQSVSRALRLLEVVGSAPRGLSPKVAARRCGLSLSTTYHLLRTLSYEGYLARLPCGDYTVGLAVAARFSDLMARLACPPDASPVLRHLAETTGHSAYLAHFDDGLFTIARMVEAPRSPPFEHLARGFEEGAHATALGKALLSTLPSRARRAYLATTGLRPFTRATVVDREALDQEIRAAVAARVFAETGQYRDDVSCLAVLVPSGEAGDPWALGVSARPEVLARDRAVLHGALDRAACDLGA